MQVGMCDSVSLSSPTWFTIMAKEALHQVVLDHPKYLHLIFFAKQDSNLNLPQPHPSPPELFTS